MGASPEVIEETVMAVIRKQGAIAAKEKADKEKKAAKEKEDKVKKQVAAEKKKRVSMKLFVCILNFLTTFTLINAGRRGSQSEGR